MKWPIAATAMYLFLSSPLFGDQIYDRDLFVDGVALANYLTCNTLNDYSKSARDETTFRAPLLLLSIGFGTVRSDSEIIWQSQLYNWIYDQPEHSIYPHQLYEKAFQITGGRVEAALVVAYNTLLEFHFDPLRNNTYFAQRFADITGELRVFSPDSYINGSQFDIPGLGLKTKSGRGDNYSAWYHFAGAALHAFISARSIITAKSPSVAKYYTHMMIHIEEDVLHNVFVDGLKRREIDYAGADFGASLASNLKQFNTCEEFRRSPEIEKVVYMYDNSEVYGDKWDMVCSDVTQKYGFSTYFDPKKISVQTKSNSPTVVPAK